MKKKNKFKVPLNIFLSKNEAALAYRVIDGQVAIIHLQRNTFNLFNVVATRMWELIDGQKMFGKILEKLHQEFDVDWSVLKKDCSVFVREMIEGDLLKSSFLMDQLASQARSVEAENGLFEELREKTILKQLPFIVHFDLIYSCNLDCVHCYIVEQDRPLLVTDEIKSILDQLAEAGTLYLTLSGGEILTRKDFFEIAQYARKLHFALRILTNGTLVNEATADKIASLNPEMVAISIYSANQKIHDKVTRTSGSFQKSVSALEMLKERNVKLKVSTVIMRDNVKNYKDIYELSRELGAVFQADYRITPKTDGDKSPLAVHIDEKYLPLLLADSIFTEKSEPEPQEIYSNIFEVVPCGAGHLSCYITPYGDMHPCVQLPINCGSLREKEFIEIWKDSPELLKYRSIKVSDLDSCSRCKLFKYCRICLGLNYVEERDIFIPSKRACKEAKIMQQLGRSRR